MSSAAFCSKLPPPDLAAEFEALFTDEFKAFLIDMVRHFDRQIDQLYVQRSIF
jgi:hypothetical protein